MNGVVKKEEEQRCSKQDVDRILWDDSFSDEESCRAVMAAI